MKKVIPPPSKERLIDVYQRLLTRYGPQHWWPGDGPFETIVGAILTQNTAWGNAEKAIANLKVAGAMSLQDLRRISEDDLARLLRPSGYFNSKARKLKAFAHHIGEKYVDDLNAFFSQDTASLRQELLSIYGIGPETADDIVLYAAGKPSFVVDIYTRRIIDRIGLEPERDSYEAYQEFFHQNLPRDDAMYNEYHALFVRHAKETCRKQPLCSRCCLLKLCPTGQRIAPGDSQDQP